MYSVLAVVASFFGLNPGLPWERERSIEGIAWLLSRLVGATAPPGTEAAFADAYDGPLGYRRYAGHAFGSAPVSASVRSASAVKPEDLGLRIRALALQIHQHRMWRRVVSAVVAVQFVLVTAATISLLAVRIEADPTGLAVAAGLGASLSHWS